jgi:hypothetical protein
MDWSDGYVSEVDYTYGYYGELNPLQTKLKLLFAGYKPPEVKTACELGFGQGVSFLCNAAATDIDWYGNDFNPNHVSFVNDAAHSAGLSLYASDEDFEHFCSSTDLPNFDFIGLHGVWSWISDKNREIISRFIAKKLNVGGVLYLSYNAEPGRTAMRPFRELMEYHARAFSAPDVPLSQKIDNSIGFMENLLSLQPAYNKAHPLVEKSFKDAIKLNKNYLAHEYFNADWTPTSIKRLYDYLSIGKLQFAASANPIDLLPDINFSTDQLALLKTINDPIFKEYVKDFFKNQDFRRDLWIKGGRKLNPAERVAEFLKLSVTLVTSRDKIDMKIKTAIGSANLNSDLYEPVLDYLEGKASVSLFSMANSLEKRLTLANLFEVCIVLAGKGVLCVAQNEDVAKNKVSSTQLLNKFFIKRSEFSNTANCLVSPISSTAIPVYRFEQLFLNAIEDGQNDPGVIAELVWGRLKSQGEKVKADGKVLETDEENINYLKNLASQFINGKLFELSRLKIA